MSDSTRAATGASSPDAGVEILLQNVTKRYPGQDKPAVDGLTMQIPAGQVVMFVGPSGCGKTTTLKMINRLIEPTEGAIILDGDDVTRMNGDKLRRRMGYVIQAGGLFPHQTVAANIAVVPKMLGWDKDRIAARVDELLELVSLDPSVYRDRYPRELSGGQQQRVGVARALAADPPVLLMDEPFGAVDPITRQRLQDELINIQAEVQKTIVCVTHDFDEAVKLGDWIAVFTEGAHLVQYDTPERILAEPANAFVENFIGSGAGLKQLTLTRVADVPLAEADQAAPGETADAVLTRMEASGRKHVVVLDERQRPLQWLSRKQVRRAGTLTAERDPELPVVSERSTLNDALDSMLVSSAGAALVTGRRDAFIGVIDVESVMDAIAAAREATRSGDYSAPVGTNTGVVPVSAGSDGATASGRRDGNDSDGTQLGASRAGGTSTLEREQP